MTSQSARPGRLSRRQVLALGGVTMAASVGGLLLGSSPAEASTSPALPGELSRQNNLVSGYGGRLFDEVRVGISGDKARLFIPQGITPGTKNVRVLWLYHGAGSSDDALLGGFRAMGERAVGLGMVAICQNLGGTLYTNPTAQRLQRSGWSYLSGLYGITRNFLRGTSHGGAMAAEVLVASLIPSVAGAYIVNGVYDIENLYRTGSARARYSLAEAFNGDRGLMHACNPARHRGSEWTARRVRVVYSQPDSSDTTVPPAVHGKALIASAKPYAQEASVRTHGDGHSTPRFADSDNSDTITRWTQELSESEASGPIARWDFSESEAPFSSSVAGVAALRLAPGSAARSIDTPVGRAVDLNGKTDYLIIPRTDVGVLNVGASTGAVTVAAWVRSTDTNNAMIAGCWQESASDTDRSYALFNDLPTYGGDDMVCMQVSRSGGPTDGYPHSIDYAAEPNEITRGAWQFYTGTYDGEQIVAYLDGEATDIPAFTDPSGATYSKNPYVFPDGVNANPTDFLVGAGLRNGSPINLHSGSIAALRVWDRALTGAQVLQVYRADKALIAAAAVVPPPVASWDFAAPGSLYPSSIPGSPALAPGTGSTPAWVSTPFGGGVELNGTTDYLTVPVEQLGALNIGATTNAVTIAAWVYSTDANNAMIAGCWQESTGDPRRSYALFNDLPVYGGNDMVCMEVSKTGGATPGHRYSIDYAAEPRAMTRGKWQLHVGTYDGIRAVAYLDGAATAYTGYTDDTGATYDKNPYQYPDGLNATPVAFNVGAVVRDSQLINLHKGSIARLRVWNTALNAAQVDAIFAAERP